MTTTQWAIADSFPITLAGSFLAPPAPTPPGPLLAILANGYPVTLATLPANQDLWQLYSEVVRTNLLVGLSSVTLVRQAAATATFVMKVTIANVGAWEWRIIFGDPVAPTAIIDSLGNAWRWHDVQHVRVLWDAVIAYLSVNANNIDTLSFTFGVV